LFESFEVHTKNCFICLVAPPLTVVVSPRSYYGMSYNVELKAAKIACAKVRDAEESVASYRLEAGRRIRAAYMAGETINKTKADVAKDIGLNERWVRELANADTPEKVKAAQVKKAKLQKDRRKRVKAKPALRRADQDCEPKAKPDKVTLNGKHSIDFEALGPRAQKQIAAAFNGGQDSADDQEPNNEHAHEQPEDAWRLTSVLGWSTACHWHRSYVQAAIGTPCKNGWRRKWRRPMMTCRRSRPNWPGRDNASKLWVHRGSYRSPPW
jgi:hypothetical protein